MGERKQIRESHERFVREVDRHEMAVLLDQGVYRHLRFKRPDESFYWFDLITWPGALAIHGDCGSFLFSRLEDMFQFFGGKDGINPHYWAQKLRAPEGSRGVKKYDREALVAVLREWFESKDRWEDLDGNELADLRRAVDEQILDRDESNWGEADAHALLRDFEHNGIYFQDTWEWDLTEWDWQFLWCCHAIVWGIEQYRAAQPAEAVPA